MTTKLPSIESITYIKTYDFEISIIDRKTSLIINIKIDKNIQRATERFNPWWKKIHHIIKDRKKIKISLPRNLYLESLELLRLMHEIDFEITA